jgi:RNA-directed DNA polymerase
MLNTFDHLCYVLRSRQFEIDQIISDIDHYYKYMIRPKKKYGSFQVQNGKTKNRDLFASRYRLKEIQQNINAFLQSNIRLPDYAYGSVKGRDHIMNAVAHFGSNYFCTIDLRDFFTNISNKVVFDTFRRYNFSPSASRKLTQLTTYRSKLQQGPPSSPFIANMVFAKIGDMLFKKATEHKIIFTSYLDDLTFSSKFDFKELLPDILKVITEHGFVLNHRKISYRKTKAELTGIIVSTKGLSLPGSVRQRATTNLRVWQYSMRVKFISDILLNRYYSSDNNDF